MRAFRRRGSARAVERGRAPAVGAAAPRGGRKGFVAVSRPGDLGHLRRQGQGYTWEEGLPVLRPPEEPEPTYYAPPGFTGGPPLPIGVTPIAEERRGSLMKKLAAEGFLRAIECQSGLCGLIAENARGDDGERFDAMYCSSLSRHQPMAVPEFHTHQSLAQSRTLGLHDPFCSRTLGVCEDVLSASLLPMIYDADMESKQQPVNTYFLARSLERIGVSACILEEKEGLRSQMFTGMLRGATEFGYSVREKMEHYFGADWKSRLSIEDITPMQEMIAIVRAGQLSEDFLIIVRLDIARHGHQGALERAQAALDAHADGVIIRIEEGRVDEAVEFLRAYRGLPHRRLAACELATCALPVTEKELREEGVSVVIHTTPLSRAAYPAMMGAAEGILSAGLAPPTPPDEASEAVAGFIERVQQQYQPPPELRPPK